MKICSSSVYALLAPLTAITLVSALSACGASDEGAGVGGVTAGEAKALNEAAAMLDARADNAAAALQGDDSANQNANEVAR
ncbi:MAG: hypothetical protein E2598_05040 [Sphingobium sp.]|nr:hypothetical protein [Sphingobium sp.]